MNIFTSFVNNIRRELGHSGALPVGEVPAELDVLFALANVKEREGGGISFSLVGEKKFFHHAHAWEMIFSQTASVGEARFIFSHHAKCEDGSLVEGGKADICSVTIRVTEREDEEPRIEAKMHWLEKDRFLAGPHRLGWLARFDRASGGLIRRALDSSDPSIDCLFEAIEAGTAAYEAAELARLDDSRARGLARMALAPPPPPTRGRGRGRFATA